LRQLRQIVGLVKRIATVASSTINPENWPGLLLFHPSCALGSLAARSPWAWHRSRATVSYWYHPVGDFEPQTAQAESAWATLQRLRKFLEENGAGIENPEDRNLETKVKQSRRAFAGRLQGEMLYWRLARLRPDIDPGA